ncbi:MAG: HEAT repeat domain-containing protein [Planctomycetes bacterium]|nr:HEAT repeat domain-containing protein [Planctomycetota bacterium]
MSLVPLHLGARGLALAATTLLVALGPGCGDGDESSSEEALAASDADTGAREGGPAGATAARAGGGSWAGEPEPAEKLRRLLVRYRAGTRAEREKVLGELDGLDSGLARTLLEIANTPDDPLAPTALLVMGDFPSENWEIENCLDSPKDDVRSACVACLERLGRRRAGPRMIRLLQEDESAAVREAAARALGALHVREASGALVETFEAEERSLRYAAVHALIALGEPAPVDRLISLLSDRRWYVAQAAVEALGGLRAGAARGAIEPLASHAVWSVRKGAFWALGELRDQKSAPLLLAKSLDATLGRFDRVEALEALRKIKALAVGPPLVAAIPAEPDRFLRFWMARTCIFQGVEEAIPWMIECLGIEIGDPVEIDEEDMALCRQGAGEILAWVSGRDYGTDKARWEKWWKEVANGFQIDW